MNAIRRIDLVHSDHQMRRRPPTPTASRPGLVTAVVSLALAAVVAAMSSLNVALPSIAQDTHASQTDLVWVIDAYSLAFAALLLPAGGIGDRYGRRRALIVGLSIFGMASAIATTADSSTELIALRAVIGAGAALVMPATLSTITSTFGISKRTRAVSIWAAVAGGAGVVGLLASGALLEAFSWRSIFVLNAVLSAIALVGTLRVVPESADPRAARLDLAGAALVVAALVALVFSVIEAPTYGWLAARTIVGLVLACVLGVIFVVWERRQSAPLLDPRIFRRRPLTAGATSIFVQFFAFYGYAFVAMQYLQIVRGDSALLAAVQVLPLAGAMIATSRLAPRLTSRYGSRNVCAAGLALVASGLAIVAQVGTDTAYGLMAAGLAVLGIGMGAAMTPATSAITEALPQAEQGVGSALNDLSREVGGAIGIAVIGSILAATYRSHVDVTGLGGQLAAQVKSSYAIASRMAAPIPDRANAAFVSAMHVSLLAAAGAALIAAVTIVVLLRPIGAGPRRAGRSAIARGRILGLALAALGVALTGSLPIPAPAASKAAPSLPVGSSAIARDYVVRFYPRWFTFEQARMTNRLIAPRRVGPLYHAVVAVNDDTLYASAFIDTSTQPAVLTIPKTTATYSLLVLDAYGNVVQTTIPPTTAGSYALTGPAWHGTLPAGVTSVPLPVNFGIAIIRADKYSGGVNETAQARRFQKSLRVQTLSQYVADPSGGATQVLPTSLFSVPFKGIADRETTQAPILFLRQLQKAVHDPSTPPLSRADAQLSQSFDALFGTAGALSPAARAQLARGVRIAHNLIIAHYHAHTIGGDWVTFTNIGAWGTDYLDRDATTEYLQFGNGRNTAAYYHAFVTGSGVPLDGRRNAGYVLTFHQHQVPDAKRFWSVTTYLPGSIELVPNATRKYVVASYTPGLETSRDGSISIYMAPRLPAGVPRANWLPVPRGRFNVMLRVYGPDGKVADNTYVPPPIVPLTTRLATSTEAGAADDPCARSRDLRVGATESAFYSTVAPFEHFASDRTQLFPYTCTLRELTGRGRMTIRARRARASFASPYIPVTRDRNQLFVYGYGKNPQTDGAFVASVNPVTLRQRWRIHIKVPPPGQWSYPGVLLAHGNGFLYAIYGNVLVKIDAASGRTLARRVLPEDPTGSGAAYNGMIVLPDGRIVAKGIERGPCKSSGTFPGLICAARNKLPSPVVVVDPNHLRILFHFVPDAPVTGRVTAGRIGGTDYVYLAEHSVVERYRYQHRDGTLQLDNGWGPVVYRTGKQTSGTGPGLLRDWLVIQTNFLPSRAPMTVTAVDVHNAGRTFQIRPFVTARRRSRSSLSISKAALDPATNSIYTADFAVGELVAMHLDPRRGLSVKWRDNIRSLDFVALIGSRAHRQLVFTDYKRGADRVVWIDATTGRVLARSGTLAHRPAPGNIVTPGFDGRFYYLGSRGQLWELRPAHATS